MDPDAPTTEVDLRSYLGSLRRRKWTIVATTVLVVGAALALSYSKTPLYQARAELLVERSHADLSGGDASRMVYVDPDRMLATEIKRLRGERIRQLVRDRLGYPAPVSARPSKTEDVISLTAVDEDPQRAQTIANTYAHVYREYKTQATATALDRLVRQRQDVQAELDQIDARVNAAPVADRPARAAAASAQREPLVNTLSVLRQQISRLQLANSLVPGGVEVLSEAKVPAGPFEPTPVRTGILALVVGLMLGAGLALVFDLLDESIDDKEDLERAAPGVAVLGLIPAGAGWRKRRRRKANRRAAKRRRRPVSVTSLQEPASPMAEAYRSLRTSIQFASADPELDVIQVTSPAAQEGKTTTVANLAVALAQAGERVIVVCCDLRRPSLHELFGLSNHVGFTSVWLGHVSLSGALQRVPGVERLRLLASGPLPPNPSEVVSGWRAEDILKELAAEGDVVLIDSPPVLPVSDAVALSNKVKGTVVVASAGDTTRRDLRRSLELLRQVNASVVGVVLNGVSQEGSYGYRYDYAPKKAARGREASLARG